jgi:hypothetical protein
MNQDEFNDAERESKFRMALIEGLEHAKPCCGEYTTCMRACTPRGRFLGARDAKREWVGLTEQEQGAIMEDLNAYGTNLYQFARAIEAKLKEKNT